MRSGLEEYFHNRQTQTAAKKIRSSLTRKRREWHWYGIDSTLSGEELERNSMQVVQLLWVLGAGLALSAVTARAGVIYSDGTFPSANWQSVVITATNGGTVSAAQNLGAGDPAPSRAVTFNSPEGMIGQTTLRLGSINTLFVYDPGVSGGIAQLDFSYSIAFLASSGAPASTGAYRPALRQNGLIYQAVGIFDITSSTNWTPFSFSSTSAADWAPVGGITNPDFSSAGSLIEFGYLTGAGLTCNSANGCAASSVTGALDNYRVAVTSLAPDPGPNPVPEPGAWTMLLSGLAALRLVRPSASASSRIRAFCRLRRA